MANKVWNECLVSGIITACDPGRNTCSGSSRRYTREDLTVGMNLCRYDDSLPEVIVRSIGLESLMVKIDGRSYTVTTGGRIDSDRKPLSYAYSEVSIFLE